MPVNPGAARLHTGKLPITKSDRVAVGLCEERVSARKLAKQPLRPRAVRSTPSSRNSPWFGTLSPLLFTYDQGCAGPRGPLFTIAKVSPPMGLPLLSGTRLPVASSPTHVKTLMVETDPPMVKSLTSRMSPSEWVPTKRPVPFPLTLELSVTLFRKNQKPAVAAPLLSNRSRPAYRIACPLLGSVYRAA